MALDIHRSDNNEYIFGINDELYNCLEAIFEQFKYATGFRIDPYGDTKLNIDNIKLLIKLVDKYIEKADLLTRQYIFKPKRHNVLPDL